MEKTFPILHTKLHPPVAPVDFVTRPKLVKRLDERRGRPLTLVSAPAGYGKSTLVSSWLTGCNGAGVWISLDENDNNPHQFITYLLAGLQKIMPTIGETFKGMLRAAELPPIEHIAASLVNAIDQIPVDFILALDDYHVIRDPKIHDLMADLLRHPPRPMHLVLVSRRDPPLPITGLRAQGKVTEVRVQDLRFSMGETAEFFQKVSGAPVDSGLAQKLESKTEGWVAGLRLLALSIRHQGDVDRMLHKLPKDSRYVMDYLVAEVLAQQPVAIQDYLVKTAILDRFCAPLCGVMGGGEKTASALDVGGQDFVDWLQAANLFAIPLDDHHEWFRYHHLFQSLLTHRLHSQHSPGDIDALHRRAAGWFSKEGLIEEALRHYLAAGDTTAATQLISAQRHVIMNAEQWHRLERWLDMLPAANIDNDPQLLLLRAWVCEYRVRLAEMRPLLDQAAPSIARISLDDPPEALSLKAEYEGLCAFLAYIEGDGDRAIQHARQSLEMIAPEAYSVRGWSSLMLAIGHQMRGEVNKAYEVVTHASQAEVPPHTTYHARLSLALSFIHWIEADLSGLCQSATQALNLCREYNLPDSIGISTYFMGAFHYLRNQMDDVGTYLNEVVDEPYAPNLLNWTHSAFVLALCLETQGQPERAREIADNVNRKAQTTGNNELYQLAEAFQAELALRQGYPEKAIEWGRMFNPRPFSPGYRFFLPQFTLVKVWLSQGTKHHLEQAATLLAELHTYYQSIHNIRYLIEVSILQSLVWERQGNAQTAMQALTQAVDLARRGQVIRPFLDVGLPMANLLDRLAAESHASDFVNQLRSSFISAAHENNPVSSSEGKMPPALANQALPHPLTNRELEILSLLAKGLRNKEVAAELFISTETVKKHTRNIYRKLSVSSRQQAAAAGYRLGVLETRRR